MGLCYFEWENDCHSNFPLNQTGASLWTQQSFGGRTTAQSSVGKCLARFFDVQASLRLCVSAQASTLVQDQGQTAGLKSGCNTPVWIIQPSSHECFYPALFRFFFTGRLDQSCLAGKRVQSLQSAWKYVWFKLEFRGGHIFTTLVFLSNVITLLVFTWCGIGACYLAAFPCWCSFCN